MCRREQRLVRFQASVCGLCAVALLRQQIAFLIDLTRRCTLRRSLHNVTFNQSTSQSADDQAAAANETADSVADAWHSLPSGACSLPGAPCASWTTTLWLHAPHAAEPVYQQTLRKCSAEVRGLPAQHASSHRAALCWLKFTLESLLLQVKPLGTAADIVQVAASATGRRAVPQLEQSDIQGAGLVLESAGSFEVTYLPPVFVTCMNTLQTRDHHIHAINLQS